MRKLVWLLALLCLAPAYYSCTTNGEAQTHTAQSSNVAANVEEPEYAQYIGENGAITYRYKPDPQTNYRITINWGGDYTDVYFRKNSDTTVFKKLSFQNILEQSPYFNLPYATKSGPKSNGRVFDVKKLPTAQKQQLTEGVIFDKNITNHDLAQVITDEPFIEHNCSYITIGYNLYLLNTNYEIMAAKSEVLIYNAQGIQIAHIKDPQHGCTFIAVTENGYLCKQFGMTWGEEGEYESEPSSKFYLIGTGELNPYFTDYLAGGMLSTDNYFYWSDYTRSGDYTTQKTTLRFFDPTQNHYYYHTYDFKELNQIDKMKIDRIIFKDGTVHYFEKDFQKHIINNYKSPKP